MYTVETSRHFVKRRDVQSGAIYYVLATHVAPPAAGVLLCQSQYEQRLPVFVVLVYVSAGVLLYVGSD